MCRLLARVGAGHRLAGVTSLRDMRVRELHQAGHSIRAVARQVGLSRSQVHRIISNPAPDMSPIAYLGPEDDDGDGDPWTDDDDGLPLADDGTDQREPSEYLTPPFDFAGLVDVPDNMPTRRRDRKIHQAPQWTDAHGLPVSQLDLWRWGLAARHRYGRLPDPRGVRGRVARRRRRDTGRQPPRLGLAARGGRVPRRRAAAIAQAPAGGLGA